MTTASSSVRASGADLKREIAISCSDIDPVEVVQTGVLRKAAASVALIALFPLRAIRAFFEKFSRVIANPDELGSEEGCERLHYAGEDAEKRVRSLTDWVEYWIKSEEHPKIRRRTIDLYVEGYFKSDWETVQQSSSIFERYLQQHGELEKHREMLLVKYFGHAHDPEKTQSADSTELLRSCDQILSDHTAEYALQFNAFKRFNVPGELGPRVDAARVIKQLWFGNFYNTSEAVGFLEECEKLDNTPLNLCFNQFQLLDDLWQTKSYAWSKFHNFEKISEKLAEEHLEHQSTLQELRGSRLEVEVLREKLDVMTRAKDTAEGELREVRQLVDPLQKKLAETQAEYDTLLEESVDRDLSEGQSHESRQFAQSENFDGLNESIFRSRSS